jgi:flagellar L-ring protein precursor FlgH
MRKLIYGAKFIVSLGALISLNACGSVDRIANIGREPEITKIENPVLAKDYQPVSLPMPAPKDTSRRPNSLWDGSRQTFFKDQRAKEVGDIITVTIEINDKAELDNETSRSRTSAENAGLDNLLGYEKSLDRILPEDIDNTSLIGAEADSNHKGKGKIDREEELNIKLAAIITQLLPNGNMVIHGRQEVRVNYEKRILVIDGVIRPEDISTENSISAEKIAEARVVYGGEGQITDVQQPRYGQQLYDVIFPF